MRRRWKGGGRGGKSERERGEGAGEKKRKEVIKQNNTRKILSREDWHIVNARPREEKCYDKTWESNRSGFKSSGKIAL